MGTRAEAGRAPEDGVESEHAARPFEVRPARRSDASSFVGLWRSVVAERRFIRTEHVHRSVRYYRRRFFRRTWEDEQATIVAVVRGRVIGHLHVAREDSPVTRHVASLGMVVAPDWRRRGVGSALITEAIRWARSKGVEKLALSVYPDNDPARALYAKFGFQEEGRLTGHSKKSIGYRDEIVMGLWLIASPSQTT
jgi:ribosomal protein S18 acetylase RimI-like enzyme